MQPQDFGDFAGQSHLVAPGSPLRRLIEEDKIVSLILYGPPGSGKTALAHIIANKSRRAFIALNAVTAGIKDIRDAVAAARHERTILFVDEIHRFNRVQQDALLPYIETGLFTLIGASTHNPFFSLVPALSSRSLIFQFKPIPPQDIRELLERAVSDTRGLGEQKVTVDEDALEFISSVCEGDARRSLNILELAFFSSQNNKTDSCSITLGHVKNVLQSRSIYYDEDDHYDTISAFIKSMRGTDPDATVYWLAKMIESGEDPLFIARRIVICAAEDVGNADPNALVVAVAAANALEKIGMPEGRIPLAQAAIYVACAPKSNASYLAIDGALEDIRIGQHQPVPDHLKDASYRGADRLGAGKGYQYPHNFESHYVKQQYITIPKTFYQASSQGFEKIIQTRLQKRRTASDD